MTLILSSSDLLTMTEQGLYCPQGDFFVDPWRPVSRAVITHGHADHARYGHKSYLCHPVTAAVLRSRLGADIVTQSLEYEEVLNERGVNIQFAPAGHIPGSAQVVLQSKGQRWVVSGDYKTQEDGLSTAFEPVVCDVFISECTFGLPLFRWQSPEVVYDSIKAWWTKNRAEGRASLLLVYSLGKAQRMLKALADHGTILAHGAVLQMTEVLRFAGVSVPFVEKALVATEKEKMREALILAPPAVLGSAWCKRLGDYEVAAASGWMAMRGTRRRRGLATGFTVSDHADWPGLLTAIRQTNASRVYLTHGYSAVLARYLREQGIAAEELSTLFVGEEE